MGQARKTQPSADAALSDLETNLRKLQAEINRRLAAMDRNPLNAFRKRAGAGSTTSVISANLARYRATSGR
jgi:hypothetical protein